MAIAVRKSIYTIFTVIITTVVAFGQDEYLQFSHDCKDFQSRFTKAIVIDNRPENPTLGFVQKGAFNKLTPVKFHGNLCDSLSTFFVTPDSAGKAPLKLTVILNELYISEKTKAISETGRLKISLRLFSETNPDEYRELLSVDSAYSFNAMDVTKKLLRSVSEHLCEIAKSATALKLSEFKNSRSYSLSELYFLDSIEKLKIPIYNAININAGIYYDYEDFKMNAPDSSVITIDTSNPKNCMAFKWEKGKNKKTKIDKESIYAVSDGHVVLKATTIGLYQLTKTNNDFYYVGQTSFSNSNNVAMWGATFGLIGAAIASDSERNSALFRFKINYRIGNSIPISQTMDRK